LRIGRGVRVIGAAPVRPTAVARTTAGRTAVARTTGGRTAVARVTAEPTTGARLSGARTAVACVIAGRTATRMPAAVIARVEFRRGGRAASNHQTKGKDK